MLDVKELMILIGLGMRKLFISLVVVCTSVFAYSQEVVVEEIVVPVDKYRVETNRFGANWFISVNGGINLYNGVVTRGESPFKHISPNVNAHFGKWHTPGFGWRAGYTGLNMKCWRGNEHTAVALFHYDAMLNLSNLFCGYKEERVYNAIPYVGLGWGGRKAYSYEDFDGLSGTLVVSYGLINTFRVAERWAINLELSGFALRNGFSGKAGGEGHDMMWSASVGVTFRLGKPDWNPAVDVSALQAVYTGAIVGLEDDLENMAQKNNIAQSEIVDLRNQLNGAEQRNAELLNKPSLVDVKQSVFFPFGSAVLDSKREELNVKAYAEAAKLAGVKLRVIGYADIIGAVEYNQQLSLQRAEAVAEMLKANGAEVVSVIGQGESSDYSIKYLNRRAIIEVVE